MDQDKQLRKSVPIHIHITTLFVGFFMLMAVVLGWYNYTKLSEILMVAAEDDVTEISQNIQQQFSMAYRPVLSSVEILSKSGVLHASNLSERLEYLPVMSAAAKLQGQVSAFQVGYNNGDYYLVRFSESESVLEQFLAPKGSRYIVDHIVRENSKAYLKRLFYSSELQLLSSADEVATDYDPRGRPWYQSSNDKPSVSKPYLFYFMQRIGITVSQSDPDKTAVIAADITLENMTEVLSRREISPSAELILSDIDGNVVAYDDPQKLIFADGQGKRKMAKVDQLDSPILADLYKKKKLDNEFIEYLYDGKLWIGKAVWVPFGDNYNLQLTAIFPEKELLKRALAIRSGSLKMNLILLLLILPLVWLVANRIAVPIRKLAAEARAVERFDFSESDRVTTSIKEIDELAISIWLMKKTVSKYNKMITTMAGEKDFTALLGLVASSTRSISRADLAAIYMLDKEGESVNFELAQAKCDAVIKEIDSGFPGVSLSGENSIPALTEAVSDKKITRFNLADETVSDEIRALVLEEFEYESLELVAIPLVDRNAEVIGLLLLGIAGDLNNRFDNDWLVFIQALSAFSALSIENRQLIKMQKELMESFIKLIASAIDAKSPYTGGHCQRVPELTKLLAKAACDDESGLYKNFDLNADQWEELHFACWLHDCGKVTTPEYVVDKSTKLETIYDRIHEVRMRFEVLKRDATIEYWQCLYRGGDQGLLKSTLDATLQQLDDDFAFIAECNEGGEYMAPDKIERLIQLSEKSWTRTLSDRIGISWEEAQRKSRTEEQPLPCEEPLLADKDEHIVERAERDRLDDNNPWGFKMPSPQHKYNRGEIYNLSVARGTLSEEERYKINDHMIQTIIMLEQLPYPKHLRNVPIIAGGHHEKMDGTGYPKKLKKDDMPLTARMMAIADIFEALTAADRPYKKAKTLSESIRIMGFMKKDNHIDPELFELFLRSGTYLKYAEKFLLKEQIDKVDIEQYLT